jgi:hypothetical protein
VTVIATLVVNRSCKMEFAHEEAAKRLNEPSEAVTGGASSSLMAGAQSVAQRTKQQISYKSEVGKFTGHPKLSVNLIKLQQQNRMMMTLHVF